MGVQRQRAGLFVDRGVGQVAIAGDDIVPAWVSRLPERALAALLPAVPTYVWLAFKGTGAPEGPDLAVAPRRVR